MAQCRVSAANGGPVPPHRRIIARFHLLIYFSENSFHQFRQLFSAHIFRLLWRQLFSYFF